MRRKQPPKLNERSRKRRMLWKSKKDLKQLNNKNSF